MTTALTRAPRKRRNRDEGTESASLQDTDSPWESEPHREPAPMWAEAPDGADPLPGQLDRWLAARGAELVALRRHIHANPELSNVEYETSKLVASVLTEAGLSPQILPKGTGVVCDIGDGGPVVALRAELDALAVPDAKQVSYRSTVDNVCHACGHDVHTTVLVGAGLALARLWRTGGLEGRVRLIFQPSEERLTTGAPEMISFGALKDVRSIFSMHCAPQLPVGLVGVRSGPFTAAVDMVEVRVSGDGGHTARPHLTSDVVHALSRVVVDVPSLLSRRVDPRSCASMIFGSVQAGDAANAIPSEGLARATIRVLSRETWQALPTIVPDLVAGVVAGTGARAHVEYVRGVPPVVNDRIATATIAGAAAAALGRDRVTEVEPSMGGEDFACYLEHVPGAMVRLGVGVPGTASLVDLHQPTFDIDERAIGHGVRVFVHTALAALSQIDIYGI